MTCLVEESSALEERFVVGSPVETVPPLSAKGSQVSESEGLEDDDFDEEDFDDDFDDDFEEEEDDGYDHSLEDKDDEPTSDDDDGFEEKS